MSSQVPTFEKFDRVSVMQTDTMKRRGIAGQAGVILRLKKQSSWETIATLRMDKGGITQEVATNALRREAK